MSFKKGLMVGLRSLARGLFHLVLCGALMALGEGLYTVFMNVLNASEVLYYLLLFLIALAVFLGLARIGKASIARDMCETICYVAIIPLVALPLTWLIDRDIADDLRVRLVFVPSVLAVLHGIKFLRKFIALQREHKLTKDLLMLAHVSIEYMRDARKQESLPQPLLPRVQRVTPDSLRLARLLARVKPETRAVLERIAEGSIDSPEEATPESAPDSTQKRRAELRLVPKEDRVDNELPGSGD